MTSQNSGKGGDSDFLDNENYSAKILIIDDEPSIRKSLKGILERHKYYVETAETYDETKGKLFEFGFDALILDIILPGINGIEILHNINKANLNLPTIMLTGAPSLVTAQESVKYGAFDYLTKPVEQVLLLNQIKNAVNKKRLVDAKRELLDKLRAKNEELEQLVEKRTEELKISEIRYRTLVEAVHDMIIIINNHGIITFSNAAFLDELSNLSDKEIKFNDINKKKLDEYITSFNEMNLNTMIETISGGHEIEDGGITFSPNFENQNQLSCSIRGIFDEELILSEIILIIKST
jgi:DNA-binding response OmpR family regulator